MPTSVYSSQHIWMQGEMFIKKIILKYTTLTSVALLFIGFNQIIYNIIIGKSFGSGILGQINLALSIAMLISLTVSSILEPSATKFLSEYLAKKDEAAIRYIFIQLQKWALIGSALLIISALITQKYLNYKLHILEDLYLISLFLIVLIIFHHLYRGCFYGLYDVENYFKFEIISSLSFILALGSVYILGKYFLFPYLIYYCLFSLLSVHALLDHFKQDHYHINLSRSILEYGAVAMIGTLASTSRAYVATIATGFYMPPDQVGFYSATVSITAALLYAPGVIDRVLLPSFSYSHGKEDTYTVRTLIEQATAGLSIVALFMGGIFIILGRDLLMVLFTPEFSAATFSLQMLVLGVCMYAVSLPSASALSGTQYVKIPNLANLAGLLVSLALWTYLIPRFGIDGTALGYVVGAFVSSIIPMYYAKMYYNIYLKDMCLIIIKSLCTFGLALFAGTISPNCPALIVSAVFAILFFIVFWKNIAFYLKQIDISSWN